ncbi:MAG: protein kinase [Phycisphaerae bacterium]
MSRTKSSCPTEAELRGFHAQEFAPDVHGTISAHLASCNQCEARAAALRREHDSWLQQLRAAGPPPDSPHVMVPAPLPEIDGYEIRSELRRGGQGIVYRALQQSTRREVAIKVLREGPFAGSAARRRFDREVELAASLQHPGIVQVFDSGVMRDGRQYLVMDCIRGVDLEAYRAAHSLDLEQTLALFAQICDAVHFAHQRGVIHRDLKPSNVLVDESGRAYVLDFGLASLVRNDAETRHTLTGHVAGTLAYLSPEQARGLPDAIDVRSDVYALGVILFELLTGKQPYRTQGDTLVALTTIAEVVPPPLAAVPPRFSLQENRRAPGDLETIVRTALAKDRARRYQSAAELSRDVMHYLKAEPIDARRDSALDLLRSALRRHQTLFAAALAFTTLAVMSAVAMGYLYLEQTRQRAIADEQRQLARNAAQIAEDRFEKVRELAKAFIHELDPLIKHVPGTAPARAFIVRTGLQYLTELQRDAENDPRLWPDLAAAYVAIGDVQGDKVSSNLNDAAAALESYRKAEKIARTLLAEGSSSSQINNTLCITLQKIGDIQESQRQFDEALKNYQEALGVAQQMSRDQPSTNMLRTVATAHERIGNVLVRLGKLDDALV